MKCLTAVMILTGTLMATAQQSADLIITNANVRTLATSDSRPRAVAALDGRIVAVGSGPDVMRFAGSATRIIDAKGRLVIPGFNDAHVHLTAFGNQFSHLDISQLRAPKAILDAVASYVRFLPKGRWVLGRGWDADTFLPLKAALDAVSPQNPVFLYSRDYTEALVNSSALKSAAAASETGLITGSLLEKVQKRVPRDHSSNWAEIVEVASNYAVANGVTSVQDVHSDDIFELLTRLTTEGKLKIRVYDCIGLGERQKAVAAGIRAASGTPMVRRGCVKGSADGEQSEVARLVNDITEADKAGLQVMVHAIGGRSNANILTAFEEVIAANGKRDRRFRVEHAARMRVEDISRFGRSGIIPSMQPALFYSGPASGDDFQQLSRAGPLAFGSDASMIDIDPLAGVHAAVNSGRRSLTVAEAVRAYTLGSAYAEFQENEKGTIEAGKLADLVILSEDIFSIERSRIKQARVLMTVVGGEIVYDNR